MNWREQEENWQDQRFSTGTMKGGKKRLLSGDTQLSLHSPSIFPSLPTQFISIYITASWS